MFWVAELYSFDAISILGFLAAHTERVELATGILPIYSRTPTLTAMTAAGLDAVSGGRFVLGLGTSGPQVIEGWHGVPFDKPLARTREIIDICRMVWKRERVAYDGDAYTLPLPPEQGTGLGKPLKIINHPVRDDIPIYIASLGPEERAAHRRAGRRMAAGVLPPRQGRRRVGRRPRDRRQAARPAAGTARDRRRRHRRRSATTTPRRSCATWPAR